MYNLKRRIFYLGIGSSIFIIFYFIGALALFDESNSMLLKKEFENKIRNINSDIDIFINNFIIALLMFIPGLGLFLGSFSAFSTGYVFTIITKDIPTHISLAVFLTPFGIMELTSYGLAISRSYLLVIQILNKRNIKESLVHTSFEIGFVAIILFFAAVIEWNLIKQFGTINSIK